MMPSRQEALGLGNLKLLPCDYRLARRHVDVPVSRECGARRKGQRDEQKGGTEFAERLRWKVLRSGHVFSHGGLTGERHLVRISQQYSSADRRASIRFFAAAGRFRWMRHFCTAARVGVSWGRNCG